MFTISAKAVIYFRRDIKTTNAYQLYTVNNLVSDIGAYLGLFLGASLVNFGKINSLILDLCFGNEDILDEVFDETKVKTITVQSSANKTEK